MSLPVLRFKPHQDRRLRAGHLWVYSNEIDTAATPLKGLAPGQPVVIENARGRFIAHAYANPHSLICARITSRDREHPLDRSLLVHRLKIALALRERRYARPFYLLVFGESDALPGLVVDRYGDHLVAQIGTAGMERLREDIVAALDKVLSPASILWRNDSAVRELEGLERYVEVAHGRVPDRVVVEEGGCRFEVSPSEGQKTGWFFDQAANRDRLMPQVEGARVLDVCSYVGAWGVRAAHAGAREVVCVDASARALEGVRENAQANGVADRVDGLQGDAFDTLRMLKAEGERFDVVVLDPPAFIKRRKDMKEGTLAYRRLNEAAISLVSRDGLLVTASCSSHMPRDELLRVVQQAARHGDRYLQLLESGQQGPDHPVHPAIPETAYLKAFYLRVLPGM
ncbi:class I SAM-dependent rRNA methyltransferase [endosymbiont of unidentified scaly snail isolate Monju]|uniref:class I SAM-dependent rRNA methyltransferase n=1 Tax=endosymbiont of unidentified scaly snail isolate Monju TaxID=1248727 RepID=UPI0003892DCA|nr:class I SAM-dependent rRNA methyltransferase [endosymbiont of unidentified scaly snail isolate Monju]BAN70016.1 23S rRNA (cytosine1962-C5)-methyltransferase [endosymbiont of unidentified scaly snail isolate Monju]